MKLHLGHFLGLAAIIIAACAAFFSVYGLSQLFAGASLAVIIMSSALEFGKLVSVTFLHKYWNKTSKLLRLYLTTGVIVLVMITSAGIYGFLSNAYQKTAFGLEIHEGEMAVLDGKVIQFKNKKETNQKLIQNKTDRASNLGDLRSIQEIRLDSMINRRYFSNANSTRDEIANANSEIHNLTSEIDALAATNSTLNDSISKYEIIKLEKKSTSSVVAEIGPLKYVAELINKPMDNVVNYFILLLILVFDPLAISLVIATSWYFDNHKNNLAQRKKFINNVMGGVEPERVVVEEENEVSTEFLNADEIWEPTIKVDDTNEDDIVDGDIVDVEDEIVDTTEDEIVDDIKVVEEVEPKKNRKPLTVDDISEIKKKKAEQGFSVDVNQTIVEPKLIPLSHKLKIESNKVERIGKNKYLENDKKLMYKNGK